MLEENFQEIDKKFLDTFADFYLFPNKKENQNKIIELAEDGQFNSAIICLKKRFKFDKVCFFLNFINKFGKDEKYLKLVYMFEQLEINQKFFAKYNKVYEKVRKQNFQNETYVFPLEWTLKGVNCRDDGLIFTPFNPQEKLRMSAYSKVRELREIYMDTKYYQIKNEVLEVFMKEYLDGKTQYAHILSTLDRADCVMGIDSKLMVDIEKKIYNDYYNDTSSKKKAFDFVDVIYSSYRNDYSVPFKITSLNQDMVGEAEGALYRLTIKDYKEPYTFIRKG